MNIRKCFFAISVALLMTASMAVRSSFADNAPEGILGSWVVAITEGPGTPDLPVWYRAHVTFVPGGGLVASITDPLLTTGHGSWARLTGNALAITILLSQFSAQGEFLGTLKARATLKLDRRTDKFSSDDYQFEFFDPNGQPTGFVGTGLAHGTRIKVEKLH